MSAKAVTSHPTSQAKLQANRANAQKSTGPRTPEGKAASSRNALTHGLCARHIVPVNDPVEDPTVFDQLVDQLHSHFQPLNIFEALCVNRIAACYWRLDRVQRYESQSIMDAGIEAPSGCETFPPGMGPADFGLPATPMPAALDFNKLLRYEQMINRELRWTLTQFRQHRADFPAADEPTAAPPPALNSQISNRQSPAPIEPNPAPHPSSHSPTCSPSHSPARNEPIPPRQENAQVSAIAELKTTPEPQTQDPGRPIAFQEQPSQPTPSVFRRPPGRAATP